MFLTLCSNAIFDVSMSQFNEIKRKKHYKKRNEDDKYRNKKIMKTRNE